MPVSRNSYVRLDSASKYVTEDTNMFDTQSLNGGEENHRLDGFTVDFPGPKPSVYSLLRPTLSKMTLTLINFFNVGLKNAFGRWKVALFLLISYLVLVVALFLVSLSGKYRGFRLDISINSFMVPDIKVSNEYASFSAAKAKIKRPSQKDFQSLINGESCLTNDLPKKKSRSKRSSYAANVAQLSKKYPYQRKLSGTLNLVYKAKGTGNIFTQQNLMRIHKIEKTLMEHKSYKKHCYKSDLSLKDESLRKYGNCTPPNSLTLFFFARDKVFDGQNDVMPRPIEETLTYLKSKSYFYFYVDSNFRRTGTSNILRAQILFGQPVKGIKDQKTEYKRFLTTYEGLLENLNNNNEVSVLYGGGDLFDHLVKKALFSDLRLALISLILIFLLLLILLFSLILTIMAIITILASVALAYFVYHVVFGVQYIGILNGVSLFVIIGIGVDDIFVFVNTFRQAQDNEDVKSRIAHTIYVAGKATFFTSFTTAVAFGANVLSPIPAIHDFGLFMAILVTTCWLSVVFIISPTLTLWHAGIRSIELSIWRSCLRAIGVTRNERLRLPDGIRDFLSGRNDNEFPQQLELESFPMPINDDNDNFEVDDDDVPLLSLEMENTPDVTDTTDTTDIQDVTDSSYNNTDHIGFRLQGLVYHFISVPVTNGRYAIMLIFVSILIGSFVLTSKLKISKEQPKFFKKDSNLQRWLDLPEVSLKASTLINDIKNLVPPNIPTKFPKPEITKPHDVITEQRTTNTPWTRSTSKISKRTNVPTPNRRTSTLHDRRTSSTTSKPKKSTLPDREISTTTNHKTPTSTFDHTTSTTKSDHTTSTTKSDHTTSATKSDHTTSATKSDHTTSTTPERPTVSTASSLASSQSEQTTRSSDLTTHKKAITATTISATVNNRKPSKGASWSNTTYNPSNYAPTTGSKITVKTGCPLQCIRGECINETGQCKCHHSYSGPSCSTYCPIKTVEGDCCYIPFKYEGEELLGCVLEDSKPWCSVVDTYTKENRKLCNLTVEGDCQFQTETPNKTCCNFPFVYKNIEHYSCIKLGEKSGTYCGTQRHAKKLEKCIIPSSTASPLCSTGCKAVAPPPDETFAFVYIVFGIKRIDKSSIDRRHVLENNEGQILYDKNFLREVNCDTKRVLKAACIICKKFNENSHLVKSGGSQCFPSSIQPFLGKMVEECEDLPQSTSSKLKSYVVFEKNDQGLRQLKWMAMAFISTTSKTSSFKSQHEDYNKWKKQLEDVLHDAPESLKRGFIASETWVKMFSGIIVLDSAIYGIVTSLVLCVAAVLIFTGHIIFFLVLTITITAVLSTVMAIFYLTGWQIGGVEAISLSILVGTSVDYCFHLVEGYILAGKAVNPSLSNKNARQWRARAALSHIGMSIISSAITTILAAVPLCFTQIQLFAKFGLIVTINTAISLFYTITLTMALLSIFGPSRFRANFMASLVGLWVLLLLFGIFVLVIFLGCKKDYFCIPKPDGSLWFH